LVRPESPFSLTRAALSTSGRAKANSYQSFSSPVAWTEMANTLTADPQLRRRFQFWSFAYGSGNPLV
jgi:hypothetical protein